MACELRSTGPISLHFVTHGRNRARHLHLSLLVQACLRLPATHTASIHMDKLLALVVPNTAKAQ